MVFLRVQRKSMKEDACTDLWAKTSDERLSRIFLIVLSFVADRSFTADGGLLQPTGSAKTTPQKTRFRSVNSTRNLRTCQKLSKWLQRQEFN